MTLEEIGIIVRNKVTSFHSITEEEIIELIKLFWYTDFKYMTMRELVEKGFIKAEETEDGKFIVDEGAEFNFNVDILKDISIDIDEIKLA